MDNFLALLYLFDAHLDQVGKEIFGALRWRRSGDYSMHGRQETLRATTRVLAGYGCVIREHCLPCTLYTRTKGAG